MTELSREERMRLLNEKLALLPGNDIRYSLDKTLPGSDPVLQGKTVLFLGSSVTYGFAALGEAFPDYMRKRDGMNSVKEAVSGTTLVWDENEKESYIERLQKMDTQIHADAFMCQLSTNDAKPDKPKPLGEISDSRDIKDFDITTITGAMEYIIAYAQKTWSCPVSFYTGTRFDNELYAKMVERLSELKDKWGISILDLWHDQEMNDVTKEDYALFMNDPVHPTRAGYRDWWTPKFEEFFRRQFTK